MSGVIRSAYFSSSTVSKPAHQHDCHQIIYIKKGEVCFDTVQGIIKATDGCMMFFNHLTEHSIHSVSGTYERYVLSIDPQYHFADTLFNKIIMITFSNSLSGECMLNLKKNGAEFEDLLSNIIREDSSDNIFRDEMSDLFFQQFLITLYRFSPGRFEMLGEKNFDTIRKIQRIFESHPENEYHLSDLAKESNMSISTLAHSFKKLTGTSVINYLTICRLDKAKLLLSGSSMNISQICESSGFSDGSNFSRLFKQNTGLSPTEYRNKALNKQG